MNKLTVLLAVTVIVTAYSCSSKAGKDPLPGPPSTVNAVQSELKGKSYKAQKAGTHTLFANDKSIEWLEPKEDDKFVKGIVDESISLEFIFLDDSSIVVKTKDKTYDGTYAVDDIVKEDEKPGIKLRISYVDEQFKFGNMPASTVTFTYGVEGINDNSLLLETPRGMNSRKIVVLMNKF